MLDALELRDVGGHCDDVRFADGRAQLCLERAQGIFVNVCDGNFQAQSRVLISMFALDVLFKKAYLANSRAAARPIPLAAPVMTATRPA